MKPNATGKKLKVEQTKGRSLMVTWLESLSLYHVMEGGGWESRTQSSWIVWPASPFFSPEMET